MNKSTEKIKSKIKDIKQKESKIQDILDNKPILNGKENPIEILDWLEKILISFRDFKKL